MTNTDKLKDKVNQAEEFARKVWLAGIGAYGKAFEEAQGQYEKLNAETLKMFNELVEKGEKLEIEAKEKLSSSKDKAKTDIDAKVAEVRTKLGLDKASSGDKIDALSAKIDALTEIVAKLEK